MLERADFHARLVLQVRQPDNDPARRELLESTAAAAAELAAAILADSELNGRSASVEYLVETNIRSVPVYTPDDRRRVAFEVQYVDEYVEDGGIPVDFEGFEGLSFEVETGQELDGLGDGEVESVEDEDAALHEFVTREVE